MRVDDMEIEGRENMERVRWKFFACVLSMPFLRTRATE
jgi:hypothetical protein